MDENSGARQQREYQIVKDLQANMQTLNQLVTYLTEEKQNSDQAIRDILTANHPAFSQLRKLLSVKYRIFFTNRTELTQWLRAREFTTVSVSGWDDPGIEEWIYNKTEPAKLLKVLSEKVFDPHGNLIIYTPQQWQQDWIRLETYNPAPPEPDPEPGTQPPVEITDDDIPF